MRIFIDESGNFGPGQGSSRTSCIAALIVPETQAVALLGEFVELRTSWTSEPELKGSALLDEQVTAVLQLLGRFDVLVIATAFDSEHHPAAQLEQFQKRQGEAFINALTPQHKHNARRFAMDLRDEWMKLSPQLMAQLFTLIVTIEDLIRLVPNYYAQQRPQELGRFDWVIDPKDLMPTRYEKMWQRIVCPVLQTMAVEQPFMRIAELDFSAFERYRRDIPDYLHPSVKNRRPGMDSRAINLNLLMRESVSFPDSRNEPGLQLVDTLAATLTKAMNQRLPVAVWRLIGPLMLQRPHREPVLRPIALGDGPRIAVDRYHKYVLNALTNRCKRMLKTDEPPL